MELTFWDGFFQTLNFEKRDVKEIKGALGIKHKILSLGIDEIQKRIIVVQDEQDPRILTMVQADVQAKIKDYNVLMVRPVSINLSIAFSSMAVLMGGHRFDKKDLEELSAKGDPKLVVQQNKNRIEDVLNLMGLKIEIINTTKPNLVSVFQEIVQQLSTLKFLSNIQDTENFSLDFGEILNFNPVVHDNSLGICPIPLYNFSVDEAESFLKKDNKDINAIILKKHAIHQFFY